MIVRISGEDQYRLEDSLHDRLNELDNAVLATVQAGDEAAFSSALAQLAGFVREHGTPVGDDELEVSDVILPPTDTTLAEAAADFSGDGLIPD